MESTKTTIEAAFDGEHDLSTLVSGASAEDLETIRHRGALAAEMAGEELAFRSV